MEIIGCDFHPSYQQIAMLDQGTGEMVEKALSHERKEEVRAFYAGLEGSVRVGLEASGQSQWFERMLAELGHEVWIGDAAKIRASCERKQKIDRRDAELLLRLLAEDRFPRIWVPMAVERHDQQLLWSKEGRKQLELLPLLPWANRRRAELLQLLDQLESSIGELDRGRAGSSAAGGTAIDDASRRRTRHSVGVHADDGAGGAFLPWQTGGQLPGTDSQRAFQRRSPATARAHQQTRQSVSARFAGGSGAECGTA